MPTASLLLGVDGGNTKSIALLAKRDGTIIGAGRAAGSSDIYAGPVDRAIARLEEAVDGALRGAAADDPAIAGAAFSLAGADWPEDVGLLERRLRSRWGTALIVNDAVGALRAAVPDGPGVVVVCGTGTATAARGIDDTIWHSSFWQESHGAHELGVRGLQAVVRAELGIEPPTALTRAILGALGEPDVQSVLHRITGRETRGRGDEAKLASILLDVAEAGDRTAIAIVTAHAEALGAMALAAARRVGIGRHAFCLALTGGVLRHQGALHRRTIARTVLRAAPGTTVVRPTLEPAAGALLLAFDHAEIPVTGPVIDRLTLTLPPPSLFDTHPRGQSDG